MHSNQGPAAALHMALPGATLRLLARLRVLVQNQLGEQQFSVRGLAEQCGCSTDHLSHRFRQATGETLMGYINRQRMARAVHLLRDPSLAIKEIASACGFASASHFISSFRAHHGDTPEAWRRRREA